MFTFKDACTAIHRAKAITPRARMKAIRQFCVGGPVKTAENRFVFHGLVQGPNVPESILYRQSKEYQSTLKRWHAYFLGDRYYCAWCRKNPVLVYGVLKDPVHRFCSIDCSGAWQGSIEYQKAWVKSIREKYGVDNPSQLKTVQDKRRRNNLRKYGVANTSQLASVQQKRKETVLQRFGTICALQGTEQQIKARTTMKERYGVEWAQQSKELQAKKEQTNLRKLGVRHAAQSKKIQGKIRATSMNRYGVPNPTQHPEVLRKIQKSLVQYKTYVANDGRRIRLQGYEPQVARWLEAKGARIESAEKLEIRIPYTDAQNKSRVYFPDLCVKLKSGTRHLVEVKSTYWARQRNVVEKYIKAQLASEERGWGDHVLVIWHKDSPLHVFKGREGLKGLKKFRSS